VLISRQAGNRHVEKHQKQIADQLHVKHCRYEEVRSQRCTFRRGGDNDTFSSLQQTVYTCVALCVAAGGDDETALCTTTALDTCCLFLVHQANPILCVVFVALRLSSSSFTPLLAKRGVRRTPAVRGCALLCYSHVCAYQRMHILNWTEPHRLMAPMAR
jgi:hypothetical protein